MLDHGADGTSPAGVDLVAPGLITRWLERADAGLKQITRRRRAGPQADAKPGQERSPSAVDSVCGLRWIGRSSRSAWNWRNGSDRAMPPSTRMSVSGVPRSAFMASIRSATWNATPSSVARARSAIDVARVRPKIVPAPRAPSSGAQAR